jgi:predicted dienelactone hydrolase
MEFNNHQINQEKGPIVKGPIVKEPSPNITVEDLKIFSSKSKELKIAISIFKPEPSSKKSSPVIILGHGIGGVKAAGLQHFASRFAANGYYAVSFDYLHWGESDGQPRRTTSVNQQRADFQDVIAWVRSCGEPLSQQNTSPGGIGNPKPFFGWDTKQILIWGSSFGGMHVTEILAADRSLVAGIAQCPCVDGFKASLKLPFWYRLWMAPYIILDLLATVLPLPTIYLGLTDGYLKGRPSLMPGEEGIVGVKNITEREGLFGDEVFTITARSAFNIMFHRPVRRAKRITAPYLVVLPEYDNQAPREAAKLAAEQAPKGEIHNAIGGHFDIYYGAKGFEQNLAGQLKFIAKVTSGNLS